MRTIRNTHEQMINAFLSLNNHFLGMILLVPTLANGHIFARSVAQEENLLVGSPTHLLLEAQASEAGNLSTLSTDLMHQRRTYTPLGSISAQEVMNSPRWCEPRIEESLRC